MLQWSTMSDRIDGMAGLLDAGADPDLVDPRNAVNQASLDQRRAIIAWLEVNDLPVIPQALEFT